jgi:hypothetical protein
MLEVTPLKTQVQESPFTQESMAGGVESYDTPLSESTSLSRTRSGAVRRVLLPTRAKTTAAVDTDADAADADADAAGAEDTADADAADADADAAGAEDTADADAADADADAAGAEDTADADAAGADADADADADAAHPLKWDPDHGIRHLNNAYVRFERPTVCGAFDKCRAKSPLIGMFWQLHCQSCMYHVHFECVMLKEDLPEGTPHPMCVKCAAEMGITVPSPPRPPRKPDVMDYQALWTERLAKGPTGLPIRDKDGVFKQYFYLCRCPTCVKAIAQGNYPFKNVVNCSYKADMVEAIRATDAKQLGVLRETHLVVDEIGIVSTEFMLPTCRLFRGKKSRLRDHLIKVSSLHPSEPVPMAARYPAETTMKDFCLRDLRESAKNKGPKAAALKKAPEPVSAPPVHGNTRLDRLRLDITRNQELLAIADDRQKPRISELLNMLWEKYHEESMKSLEG